jgi:hypothetical protein
MRSAVIGSLILVLAAGCFGRGTSPAAVQPTLAAIETLGFRCGDGARDNVPSGLFQWSCGGAMEASRSSVLVDGNADGVMGITLFVDDPRDPGVARSGFGRLVDAVPPLSSAPVLKATIAGWTGGQQAWTVGGVRIYAQCDVTQCVVIVMPAGDALRPLPLPYSNDPRLETRRDA